MHPNIKSLFPSYVYVEGKIDNFDDSGHNNKHGDNNTNGC